MIKQIIMILNTSGENPLFKSSIILPKSNGIAAENAIGIIESKTILACNLK